MTIKKRLIIYFVVMSLVPLLIAFILGINSVQTSKEKDMVNSYKNVETAFIDDIEKTLFERMQNIKLWSTFKVMDDILAMDAEGSISNFIGKFQKNDPNFSILLVTDKTGTVVASTDNKFISKSLADDPGIQEVIKTGQFQIKDVHFNKIFGMNTITMYNPINSSTKADDRFGYFVAVFNLDVLLYDNNEKLNITGEGQNINAYVQLFNSEHLVISAPNLLGKKEDIILNPKKRNNSDLILEGLKNKSFDLVKNDGKVLVFLKADGHKVKPDELPSLNWYAVAEIDEAMAYGDISKMKVTAYISIIIIFIFVVFIAIYISNKFTKPIVVITATSQKIAIGDLNIEKLKIKGITFEQWKYNQYSHATSK